MARTAALQSCQSFRRERCAAKGPPCRHAARTQSTLVDAGPPEPDARSAAESDGRCVADAKVRFVGDCLCMAHAASRARVAQLQALAGSDDAGDRITAGERLAAL